MGKGTGAERLIDWTGERCVPWTDDLQVIYEHYHRYAFAARFVAGKRVLDLASGEGYGGALLARTAAEVVGLEIDPRTVEHARTRYPGSRFEVGSITDPKALDGETFDVITCFEAIEHVDAQDKLMELVTGKLAPGGVFLCSTPDIEVYTHDHGNENPYHVHELTESAFRSLLAGSFEHVVVLRQNVAVGSLIHDGGAGLRRRGPHRPAGRRRRLGRRNRRAAHLLRLGRLREADRRALDVRHGRPEADTRRARGRRSRPAA